MRGAGAAFRRNSVAALLALAAGCGAPTTSSDGRTGMRFLAAGDAAGFATAREPRPFVFPADHGSHPEFRTEWWYFTGNLAGPEGRHFGFELTLFRLGLSGAAPQRESPWRTNQAWMGHFALTDTAGGRFHASERFARGANGLAGAMTDPLRVWLQDWSIEGSATANELDIRVRAADAGREIDLRLVSSGGVVAQGDDGLDSKGPEPGNASYYYSVPRMAASGSVRVDGVETAVTGTAWFDREWGTSALGQGVEGWDWFAFQLADGRDLMFYRLRRADGTSDPHSGGSIRDVTGGVRALGADDVRLEPTDTWTSPSSGVTYPIAWRLSIDSLELTLETAPYLEQQEIDLSVRYWEGAVRITGADADGTIEGQGYVELAGY